MARKKAYNFSLDDNFQQIKHFMKYVLPFSVPRFCFSTWWECFSSLLLRHLDLRTRCPPAHAVWCPFHTQRTPSLTPFQKARRQSSLGGNLPIFPLSLISNKSTLLQVNHLHELDQISLTIVKYGNTVIQTIYSNFLTFILAITHCDEYLLQMQINFLNGLTF